MLRNDLKLPSGLSTIKNLEMNFSVSQLHSTIAYEQRKIEEINLNLHT